MSKQKSQTISAANLINLVEIKSNLTFEIGLMDADLGLVRMSKPTFLESSIYQNNEERQIFSIKEILIHNWPFNAESRLTVHGYQRDKTPFLHFIWKYTNSERINQIDLDAAFAFILDVMMEHFKPTADLDIIWANWEGLYKTSQEIVQEEKEKSKKFMVIDFWDTESAYFEIGGYLSETPTVKECVEIYCDITYQFHTLYSRIMSYLRNMRPTKDYLDSRKFSLESKKEIKVFVSYSGKYKTTVKKVLQALSSQKINFWFDEHEIKLGDYISSKIEKGIEASNGFLFFVSPDISEKFYPRAELSLARTREEKAKSYFIIPVLLDRVDNLHLPLELSGRRYIGVLHANKKIDKKNIEQLKIELIQRSHS